MAINNATLGGTTPAMFGTATGRYSNPWYGPDDQVYSVALTRRLAESAATATEILNRRNAEERLTGPRLRANTDEPMWRIRMTDIPEPGFGFWSSGTSEDFEYSINDAVTRAQIAECEHFLTQETQVPVPIPGEYTHSQISQDGSSRRRVMAQALPELRAVRPRPMAYRRVKLCLCVL